jgi:hypothetical protein
MRLALQGLGLFACIPLVLLLYLRQPLGPGASVMAGLVIMVGHRFVTEPWMARHATQRCVWCGRGLSGSPVHLQVTSGGRAITLAACCAAHRDHAARFLTFISRRRAPIGAGIFVPLLLLLSGSLALAVGRPFLPHEWNTWQFKTIVAFTVVLTSIAYRFSAIAEPLRSPFPLHNLFLLGIRNTLWVFRVVGAWWLVAGLLQVLQR